MHRIQQLLIVSHVPHFAHAGGIFAYGPYAREIDIWAELFPRVVIAAPFRDEAPPPDALRFAQPNISIAPQLQTGGMSVASKFLQIIALPIHAWRLAKSMRHADAIHVRCPGNLGLLGCVISPLFRRPRIAKYAGQWNTWEHEPLTYRLQKWLLRSNWWGAPVLVYGRWVNQPPHVVPFFTSVMDDRQMQRASLAQPRMRNGALGVLFVGRLSQAKNVDVILRAVAVLVREQKHLEVTIVGDGPERASLETIATTEGIRPCVTFAGAVPQERVFDFYEQAHVVVLASETEGWPKALSEGMAFAAVCIGSNRGLVPQMLADDRGLLVEPGSVPELASALRHVYNDPVAASRMAQAAAEWSRRFTLGEFSRELRRVLEDRMRMILAQKPPTLVTRNA